MDQIACDRCERAFVTLDGAHMLAVIKGPCPDCGGRFVLVGPVDDDWYGSPVVETAEPGTPRRD